MRSTDTLLLDMLVSARLAREHIQALNPESFKLNIMARDAVERRLAIIGEAASKIDKTFQASHPEIPWAAITGQRHILIHAYDIVDVDLVWDVLANHIPVLIAQLEKMLGDKQSEQTN